MYTIYSTEHNNYNININNNNDDNDNINCYNSPFLFNYVYLISVCPYETEQAIILREIII